ncbi:phage protein [Vibrio cyclitrophicus]|uniref:phage protein n=1 Tax=Vibrio cyclitrophicus TaxID=47951 RepID=UPI0002E01B7C|nr:phage protein [Vibrio cyclitrophicus]ERM57662.1 S-adenosylhomocysteine hydrolase [Vibrio cyclitrophicus FF75]OEE44133.1 S-adenosylhomocysteine hydrolase [Vibrio cyclitrophicus FF75]
MFLDSFNTLYWRQFDSVQSGADYFHVSDETVRRWLKGIIPVNPMAEKLLLIKSLGYLPNDIRWKGFRIHEERGILITPEDREFSPKELDVFVYWRDEYRQLVELHGRIDNPIKQPAKENLQPFRGGRRSKAAPWIPSKHKFK